MFILLWKFSFILTNENSIELGGQRKIENLRLNLSTKKHALFLVSWIMPRDGVFNNVRMLPIYILLSKYLFYSKNGVLSGINHKTSIVEIQELASLPVKIRKYYEYLYVWHCRDEELLQIGNFRCPEHWTRMVRSCHSTFLLVWVCCLWSWSTNTVRPSSVLPRDSRSQSNWNDLANTHLKTKHRAILSVSINHY